MRFPKKKNRNNFEKIGKFISINKEVVAGIDIGGTKIVVVLQNMVGERIAAERLPTQPELSATRLLENTLQSIEKMLALKP